MPDHVYRRRISAHEAQTGRFMVLRSALKQFPPIGEEFTIILNSRRHRTQVEAEHCTCRGPEKPHEHYFVPFPGLQKGDIIELAPDPEDRSRYIMRAV